MGGFPVEAKGKFASAVGQVWQSASFATDPVCPFFTFLVTIIHLASGWGWIWIFKTFLDLPFTFDFDVTAV
jgi:hypothetical protein